MNRSRFEAVVESALASLPAELREKMQNVQIVIEDWPEPELLEEMGLDPDQDILYGLYLGTPLTEREFDAVAPLPDKISIYQKALEEDFGDDVEELKREIRTTVVHELAHHFGIEDDELEELGWE